MGDELLLLVKSYLQQNLSFDEIKDKLSERGFLDDEIDSTIEKASSSLQSAANRENKALVRFFSMKELFDRIGYGFVSNPFVNILFYQSGASLFLIGLINGLRMVLSLVLSSFIKEYTKVHYLKKSFMSNGGLLFGFSFLLMAAARMMHSPSLFAIALLLGGVGVVTHGELYMKFLKESLKQEKKGRFLGRIAYYGVLITSASMLVSGFIIDKFPASGEIVKWTIMGKQLPVLGYVISFEITAFAFILSGYILSFIKEKEVLSSQKMSGFFTEFISRVKLHRRIFFKNKVVLLLTICSTITGLIQVFGTSYYGLFIYDNFKNDFFGGFLNVSIVFVVAIIASLFGPTITRKIQRNIGVSPMLVFGTLLTAMLPLALFFHGNFVALIVASALSIVGGSIVGVGQSLFTRKLLFEEERNIYFSFLGLIISVPMLILVPLMAYLAQVINLIPLFKIFVFVLCLVVAPLYFLMVLLYERTIHAKV